MPSVHVQRKMPASREAVWQVLADFPNIADWNGGVKKSFATGDQTEGVGATRHCDLAPLGALEETIRGWQPNEQLVVSIDSAKKLPIKKGEVTFDLAESADGTAVSLTYNYDTKFGFIGSMMSPILDKQLKSGFEGFLGDLETAALATA